MRDYMLPKHKIVQEPPIRWWLPIALVAVMCMAIIQAIAVDSITKAQRVKELEAKVYNLEANYGIQIVNNGDGFKCSAPTGVRREWEAVIGQKCKELATIMFHARSKP